MLDEVTADLAAEGMEDASILPRLETAYSQRFRPGLS